MSLFAAMCLFALSMSISPGPVNLITLSTGVNHGFKRALPFVSGATIGFTLLLILTGMGVGALMSRFPLALQAMALVGALFICWIGWQIAASDPSLTLEQREIPGFSKGFLLQWLNPKAWSACLAGISAFNTAAAPSRLAVFALLYFIICYLSIGSWAVAGEKLKAVLGKPERLKLFNRVLGAGLMGVAVYLLAMNVGTMPSL
ncbi:MAG: LysE family translocator [Desulfobacterales bacterium]|nr:LysE family translocator [Desulfobacterales bacterium]